MKNTSFRDEPQIFLPPGSTQAPYVLISKRNSLLAQEYQCLGHFTINTFSVWFFADHTVNRTEDVFLLRDQWKKKKKLGTFLMDQKECQGEISISCHDAYWVKIPNWMFFFALLKQLSKICMCHLQTMVD